MIKAALHRSNLRVVFDIRSPDIVLVKNYSNPNSDDNPLRIIVAVVFANCFIRQSLLQYRGRQIGQ